MGVQRPPVAAGTKQDDSGTAGVGGLPGGLHLFDQHQNFRIRSSTILHRPIVKLLLTSLIALPLLLAPGRLAAQAASADVIPSVTLPPALERVLRDYERSWQAGDATALAALFTPDGFVLQPNRPPVRGHAELERRYRGQGGNDLRLRALAYATADSVGYIIGAYGYGDTPGDLGKFTLTLRRVSDRWLIFSDMDNSSAPPRRPPPP